MKSWYMPAEWQPHDACLIIYPYNASVFRSDKAKCDLARAEVRRVAFAIRDYGKEDVVLFCNSADEANELKIKLLEEDCEGDHESDNGQKKTGNSIIVKVCESDDSWCRDTGPTFAFTNPCDKEGTSLEMVGIDWGFNAYGGPEDGCYWPCDLDKKVAESIISILSKDYYLGRHAIHHDKHDKFILEGGSFHTDGEGTILTTAECLLNKNRNPHLSKEQIETILLQKLGATKVIWLPDGIAFDDDTNGHVDNIATFARPGEVVLSWTDDVNDVNYSRVKAAENVLCNEVDAKGRNITIHRLHVPDPMFYAAAEVQTLDHADPDGAQGCDRLAGERLAASYVNYYLANNAVILPQFGDKKYDKMAEEKMKEVFPALEIVCVYSREILLGGGNIHCITQQLPRLNSS